MELNEHEHKRYVLKLLEETNNPVFADLKDAIIKLVIREMKNYA